MRKTRFNRYCLEDSDEFFMDVVADYYPPNQQQQKQKQKHLRHRHATRGMLRLCARSLFFEPDDFAEPILMFRFRDIFIPPDQPDGEFQLFALDGDDALGCAQNSFYFETNIMVCQMQYNRVVPWEFRRVTGLDQLFSIPFGDVVEFILDFNTLIQIDRIATFHERVDALEQFRRNKAGLREFKLTSLHSPAETIFLNKFACRILPRIRISGHLVLTNEFLYFQDVFPVEAPAVKAYRLRDIRRVERRRYALHETAIEIALYDDTVLLFVLGSQEAREDVYMCLGSGKCSIERIRVNDVSTMQQKWLMGDVSNFDYLMYLNWISGRSFNDLAQYPVFPWVVSDYTSTHLDLQNHTVYRDLALPIGALNAKRLEGFYNRYKSMREMGEHADDSTATRPFLYSTHFSNPSYVAYFLVRARPEFMLSLHGGKFDKPERMFDSVPEVWESVLNSPFDVKELIPEFYSGDGSFLRFQAGHYDPQLGVREDGKPVEHSVALPPWASSPSDFVYQLRAALESEYVSANLHKWIDLMFGFRQTGRPALEAHNLFHPHTYETVVEELKKEQDPIRRLALETHAMEVGQMPKQLFTAPHPARQFGITTSMDTIHMNTHVAFDSDDLGKKLQTPEKTMPSGASGSDLKNLGSSGVNNSSFVASPATCPDESVSQLHSSSFTVHEALSMDLSTNNKKKLDVFRFDGVAQGVHPQGNRVDSVALMSFRPEACVWWMDDEEDESAASLCVASGDVSGNLFFTNPRTMRRARSTPSSCGTVTLSTMTTAAGAVADNDKDAPLYVGSHNGTLYCVSALRPPAGSILFSQPGAHNAGVTSVAVTKDERHIASGSWNGDVRIWSTRPCGGGVQLMGEWEDDDMSSVACVDFGKCDGNLLCFMSMQGTLATYDVRCESVVHSWTVPQNSIACGFVKEENIVVVHNDGVSVYDVRDGRLWSTRSKKYTPKFADINESNVLIMDTAGALHCLDAVVGNDLVEESDDVAAGVFSECGVGAMHRSGSQIVFGLGTGDIAMVSISSEENVK